MLTSLSKNDWLTIRFSLSCSPNLFALSKRDLSSRAATLPSICRALNRFLSIFAEIFPERWLTEAGLLELRLLFLTLPPLCVVFSSHPSQPKVLSKRPHQPTRFLA